MIRPATAIGLARERLGPARSAWTDEQMVAAFAHALSRVFRDIPAARLLRSGALLNPDDLPPVSALLDTDLPIDSQFLPLVVEAMLAALLQAEADSGLEHSRAARHEETYRQMLRGG